MLILPNGERWAIEIKQTLQPKMSRGFEEACADLDPARRLFAFPGTEPFPVKNDTKAMPMDDLMRDLAETAHE